VLGAPVRCVESGDGLRLLLDDGFLMLRRSGTEPLLRVYAEAPDPRRLGRRLAEGMRWLANGGLPR
jgi:phosphomannomutase